MSEQHADHPSTDPAREAADPTKDPVEALTGVGADPTPDRDPSEPSDLANPRPDDEDHPGA